MKGSEKMAKKEPKSLFRRLTTLFRSSPVVRKKVRGYDTTVSTADGTKSSGALLFQKSLSPTYATITANAYNLSERLMRYQDFCLAGDTYIAVANKEGALTIKELCERHASGEEFWTFSYDLLGKEVVAAKISAAAATGRAQLLEVKFDSGDSVFCTAEHRFLLKDGSYARAIDLLPGVACSTFSRRSFETPYRYVHSQTSRGWRPEHVLVAEAAYSVRLAKKDKLHVHHKNFVHLDNRPQNLEIMPEHDHMSLHAKINNLRFEDPEQRRRMSDVMKSRWTSDGDLRLNLAKTNDKLRQSRSQVMTVVNRLHKPGRGNAGRFDQAKLQNANADKSLTFQDICNAYTQGMKLDELVSRLKTTRCKVLKRLSWQGYRGFKSFSTTYDNHKVVSVSVTERFEDVYDLTVDDHHNFAICRPDGQGIVIVHNCEMELTAEISAALDLWADEVCLSKDSIVPLLDGTRPTALELFESGKEDFWVYSYDVATGNIVPGQAKRVVKTGKKLVYRVNLDDGTYLRLTGNHRVLMSNGTYVPVEQLEAGDSLRSLYTKLSSFNNDDYIDGYEQVLTSTCWKYTHRMVAEHMQPHLKGVIHHCDINKRNNEPGNLRFMSRKDHQEIHRQINSSRWKNPAFADKMKRVFSESAKKSHSIPGFTARCLAHCQSALASYDQETRKYVFGRRGQQNGMYANGNAIAADRNGRWNSTYVRTVTRDQILGWIFSGRSAQSVCEELPIRFKDLHRCMQAAGIKKWAQKHAVEHEPIFNRFSEWRRLQPADVDLKRCFSKACSFAGVTRNQAYYALLAKGYKTWGDFIDKTNHLVVSVVAECEEDVFDLEVKEWHNFAVTAKQGSDSYVFVHNCAQDDKGRILHVFSDNERIQELLEDLFDNVINFEFNGRSWVRNLCKFGDTAVYIDVSPERGVVNAFPIPINELEREENFDPNDPFAVRYRWITLGNRILENWEVAHFRLLGNDMFLPYGTSVIDAARRIWRQLILIEDAMLVYRIVRAPERRVFYVDVGNMPPENIPMYVEEQRKRLRTSQVIDNTTGRVDLRYNPLSIDEDYVIPVRGQETGTRIDTLSGGQNTAAVEDVAYIQKKLFAALKIPRAYLGYDDALCLTGDTRVPLFSGESIELNVLVDRHIAGIQQYVYSSTPDGKIVPGKVIDAWKTKDVTELYEVKLDSGGVIRCTANHPFMLRDGTYVRADELVPGQSLMPLYRKLSSKADHDFQVGYEKLLDNSSGMWKFTHRVVDEEGLVVDHSSRETERSYVVHHVDHDKRNNDPSNLVKMGKKAHVRHHSVNALTLLTNESRDRLRQTMTTEKYKTVHRQGVQTAWDSDDGTRRALVAANNSKHKRKSLDLTLAASTALQCKNRREFFEKIGMTITGFSRICGRAGVNHCEWLTTFFGNKRTKTKRNHKVLSVNIVRLDVAIPVYDITIENHHNFAVQSLSPGSSEFDGCVIVSNSSKASLAQIDIRFSRSVQIIQKTVLAELNKIAVIHLYSHGFSNDDLQNFTLRLSNPSTVAQQQKLELWRSKFEIGGSLPEGMGSKRFVQREIWGLSDVEIDSINKERLKEKSIDDTIESSGGDEFGGGGGGADAGGADLFGGGEDAEPAEEPAGETPPEENAGEEPEEDESGLDLLTSGDDPGDKPIIPNDRLRHSLYNRSRRRHHGASKTHMPDFAKMTAAERDVGKHHDADTFRALVSDPFGESGNVQFYRSRQRGLSADLLSTLRGLESHRRHNGVLTEGIDQHDVVDVDIDVDDND